MAIHPLAGKPAPRSLLVNVPRLVTAYYAYRPDPDDPLQRVAFGTSGHRGSSLRQSFNESSDVNIAAAIIAAAEASRSTFGIPGALKSQ